MRLLPFALLAAVLTAALPLPTNAQATETLTLLCDAHDPLAPADPPTTFRKMEATYLDQTYGFGVGCWAHVGIQQYFVGVDHFYKLYGGHLRLVSVEHTESPPANVPPTQVPLRVEISNDGLSWETVYTLTAGLGGAPLLPVTYHDFTLAEPKEFRFIRGILPNSLAQGLSGYLDYFHGTISVSQEGLAPAVADAGTDVVHRACSTDVMEDPVAAHPCFYGGIDNWDSVSSFHTYFLGDAKIKSISGVAHMQYFRYALNGLPTEAVDAAYEVQVSHDGYTWQKVKDVTGDYGLPMPFQTGDLGDVDAKFVRLAAGRHAQFDARYQTGGDPAFRRTEGLLLDSDLQITGSMLVASSPPSPLPVAVPGT